ncbi:hypothetical protein J7E70_08470 [Variovorax paradoxus]|nr:hypothetical protein [Variovorax paradoxus]MBT2300495.1 hypothetical protein [Variovorax paradoxus]
MRQHAAQDNCRPPASRGLLFYRLLQQAVVTAPVTYGDVVKRPKAPLSRSGSQAA